MNNTAIKVSHLAKVYKLYDKPIDRLKESLHPLKKQYHKDFYALNDVSFEIKKGETVGIIGKNGAGKSTLLKIITGVLTPSSGHVHVDGRIASLLELGAGFNPEYTGVENIYLQGTLMGYTREEMESKIDDILAFADIGDFVHQPVKMYSSGMFARLAFAVAINVEPDILIVDEALSVGDVFFQQKCNLFMKEKMNNITKLIVTHDLVTLAKMTDSAILIENGKKISEGDPLLVIEHYQKILHNTLFSTNRKNIDSNHTVIKNLNEKYELELIEQFKKITDEQIAGSLEAKIISFNISINKKNISDTSVFHGDIVDIDFIVTSNVEIKNIIAGYIINDRFGSSIFGENTLTSNQKLDSLNKGSKYLFHLEIIWPEIQEGEYFLTIGLGDGTDTLVHKILCWAHNIEKITSVLKNNKTVHALFNNQIINSTIKEI
ncbi:MAG: hypothetical protein KN64_03710 [Sulfurovum sp. AS07-7]|nr:MAG: hypothetical protein KN64_03710 [Sulfurovum sp. AS07-7]